jgi:hypothetical protein
MWRNDKEVREQSVGSHDKRRVGWNGSWRNGRGCQEEEKEAERRIGVQDEFGGSRGDGGKQKGRKKQIS